VLDVLCNLIFLPVLRNFTSWLRTTPLVQLLPLGEEIYFHKTIAVLIAGFGFGHVYSHYKDFVWHEMYGTGLTFAEQAYGTWSGFSGLIIMLCMTLMFVTAIEKVRRRRWGFKKGPLSRFSFGGYSMFVRVHKLWIPVLMLLWTHSRAFWHYSLAPTALLILDRLIGRLRGKVPVALVEATAPTRDVIALKLRLQTHRKFRYKSGQYLFLHCPAISQTEWHPFTISSSPEERHFSVHIRCRPDMDWTYALKTALLPDDKMRAKQAEAREKLRKLQEEEEARAKAQKQEEALKAAQKKQAAAAAKSGEPDSPRLDGGGAASNNVDDSPMNSFFGMFNFFGGGDEKRNVADAVEGGQAGEQTAVCGGGGVLSEQSKADKMRNKSERRVLGGVGRSHKIEENTTREHPSGGAAPQAGRAKGMLQWRRRKGEESETLSSSKPLPLPTSSTADGPSPPPSPPSNPEAQTFLDDAGNAVELYVDGPYGTASEEVFGFEVLVLVGAGIGVTPFASILKTLAIQAKQDRLETPLKKVAFYWVCRDDKEFETFRDLLVGIVDDRAIKGIFELNTYITGEIDLKKVGGQKQYGYNQFAGRPDWNRIGGALRKEYPDSDVGVFLCGPNAIGVQLANMCNKYNPPKKAKGSKRGPKLPRFYFHKENF